MAGLTRKFIKDAAKDAGVELPAEMIDAIIGAHVESRDAAIETAVKPLNEQLEAEKGKSGTDEFKTKWEQEHEAFEKYKGDIENEKLTAKKQSKVEALLADISIGEKHKPLILEAIQSGIGAIELDKDGNIKDVDTLKSSLVTKYSQYVETTEKKPAATPTPPTGQTTPLGDLQAQYDAAIKSGRTVEAVAAKNKMFELQKELKRNG